MPRNWLEWVTLAVGLAALTLVVGVLVADEVTSGDRPAQPRVELHLDRAYEAAGGWFVPATLTNEGDEAAEAINVVATATVGGEPEQADVVVDYGPPGSAVDIAFGFSAAPDGEIEVVVTGFRLP